MELFNSIQKRIRRLVDGEYRKITDTLQAHSETELLVILGSELSQYSSQKGVAVDDVDMEKFATSIPYHHVPIYGHAFKAISMLDDAGVNLVREYAKHHQQYKPRPDEISKIAIAGGGGKGNVYVGAIAGLEDAGVMQRVTHIAGASAGAITALTLSLGYTADEVEGVIKDYDFNKFFYNSSDITRTLASGLARFSDILPGAQTSSRLKNITEGNYVLEAVQQHVAMHLDDVVSRDPRIKSMFDDFLVLGDADSIRFNLDQTKSDEDLLMLRLLERNKQHRMFHEDVVAVNPGRLDNRAKGDIWVHQYGQDPLADDIYSLMDALSRNEEALNLAAGVRNTIIKEIGRDAFKSNEEVLTVAVRMRRGLHQIEEFFGDVVEKKLDLLVSSVGVDRLKEIDERLETREGRRQISLYALNRIAIDIPESNFKRLDMAITKGQNLSSVFDGEGIIVDHTKKLSLQDPAVHLARISLSIPIVFNTVRTDLGNFVDGGVRHNLPTAHWDERAGGFDKSVLSIIPVTEQEALNNHGFNNIFGPKMKRLNKTYDEMSLRESFRTVILNTGQYDTMDFKFDPDDFERLKSQAEMKIKGDQSLNIHGVFHPYYNAQLSFLDTKLINFHDHAKFNKILDEYNRETISSLAKKSPFQHMANRETIIDQIKRAKNNAFAEPEV